MWLEEALDYMESASVISFEDQCNPNLPGTNFLIKREYIEKYSGVVDAPNTVFHQGYYHNYCDRELVAVAAGRSQFAKCAGVLRHYHPIVDRADWDAVYMMANSYMIDDSMLFASREKLWF
jgi:hypothetical protein